MLTNLKDVVDAIGVIEDQTSGLTFHYQWPFFALSFYAAAHKAVVLLSLLKKLPKAFLSSKMVLDHFMRKKASFIISD